MVAAGGRANLPDDLIREFLLKLPIKALIKFKLVSKKWLGLITSHNFFCQQHSVAKFQNFQLCAKRSASFLVLRTPMNHNCPSFVTRIFVSSGGSGAQKKHKVYEHIDLPLPPLKFTRARSLFISPAGFGVYCIFEFGFEFGSPNAALWNPTTGEAKVLPPSFYDSSNMQFYGFGYIESKKDENFSYKVGRISYNRSNEYFSLELYSSNTNSWKLIPYIYTGRLIPTSNWVHHGANLYGRFHWLMWRGEGEGDPCINSFDYYTEDFTGIDIPVVLELGRYDMNSSILTLYDDKFLCLVLCWTNECNMRFLDIWSMHEYGVKESWTKEYMVGPIPKQMEVLGFWNNVRAVFLRGGGDCLPTWFYICDCVSSKIKRFRQVGSKMGEYLQITDRVSSKIKRFRQVRSKMGEYLQITECVESLVAIKGMADQTSN